MAVAVKKHAKVDIKLFLSCPVLLDFSIFFPNILLRIAGSYPFMHFIKPFYSEPLNTIMSVCLPVWHFAALFLHFSFINHHILLFQFTISSFRSLNYLDSSSRSFSVLHISLIIIIIIIIIVAIIIVIIIII